MKRLRLTVICGLVLVVTGGSGHKVCAQSGVIRDHVSFVEPGMNVTGVSATASISVELTSPLDPLTVRPETVRVFGRWSGPAAGRISLENANTRIAFRADEPFFAGEIVTVSISDSVRFSDGKALDSGFAWQFWVATAPANIRITEIARVPIRQPGESLIQSYGAYAGDLDDDGWSDLVIPNEQANDIRVFINRGGSFDDFHIVPLPFSSVPSTNEGADFNRDGYLDVAVGSGANENVHVAFGDGTGALSVAKPIVTEGNVRGLCVLDVDADGDEDIVTASRASSSLYLLINNGDGSFRNRVAVDGHGDSETSCAVGDANRDGIMDLFVGSLGSRHISLLLGNGRGGLNMSNRVVVEGRPWMLAAGDVNNDGLVDVVAAGSDGNSVSVVLGDGTGLLAEPVSYPSGLFPLAIDLGDLDGDGDLDMVSSNFRSADYTVFENLGDGTFRRDRSYPAEQAGSCAILHDRDNDGDLDITAVDELEDLLILFETSGLVTGNEEVPRRQGARLLDVWPNPFSDQINISVEADLADAVRVDVYDALGRLITSFAGSSLASGTNLHWKPAGAPSGLYFAVLHADGHSVTVPVHLRR